MNDREKKLVLLLGVAAFVIVNVFGISKYKSFKTKLSRDLIEARGEVDRARMIRDNYDLVEDEMIWVQDHLPVPKAGQMVATELEQYATSQATSHQLTLKGRSIRPNDESGINFHRAKVEFKVSGREESFYRWLDRLHAPDQFRAVTSMRLTPEAKDDTNIDATIEVEQWYIPAGEGDSALPEDVPEDEEEATPEESPNPPEIE